MSVAKKKTIQLVWENLGLNWTGYSFDSGKSFGCDKTLFSVITTYLNWIQKNSTCKNDGLKR